MDKRDKNVMPYYWLVENINISKENVPIEVEDKREESGTTATHKEGDTVNIPYTKYHP